jgi:hypothetical protein
MIGIAFLFPLSFGTFDVGGDFILRGMEAATARRRRAA